jgi:hypothetical protein
MREATLGALKNFKPPGDLGSLNYKLMSVPDGILLVASFSKSALLCCCLLYMSALKQINCYSLVCSHPVQSLPPSDKAGLLAHFSNTPLGFCKRVVSVCTVCTATYEMPQPDRQSGNFLKMHLLIKS